MKRILLSSVVMTLALAALARAQEPVWPDARTARIIGRYVEILQRRPLDDDVFRNLATRYDLAGRLDELDQRLRKVPGEATPLLLRGHLERYRGNAAAARDLYRKAVGLPDGGYLAFLMLARTLDELGEWAEAERNYRSALAAVKQADAYGLDVADETTAICRALGRIALNTGRPDDARACWGRLVELDPNDLRRREELADIFVENALYDDAVRAYEKIVELTGDDAARRAKALNDIAGVYERAGRIDEAFAAYRRVLAVTARGNWLRRQVLDGIFRLAEKSGRLEKLEAELADEVTKAPDDVETWQRLVRVRRRLVDREGLGEAFQSLVRLRPGEVALRADYVRYLLDAGRLQQAVAELRELARRDAKDVRHRFELARALLLLDQSAEAQAVWQGIGVEFVADAHAQLELGRALEDAGRYDLAREAHARAVAASPDEVTFRRELGEFEMRRGRRDDAVKAWQGIVAARPENVEAHVALAKVFRENDMPQQAHAAYRRAAELSPKDPLRWRDLAGICLETDRAGEAAEAWEKVAELAAPDAAHGEAWEQVVSIHQSRDGLGELLREYRERHGKHPDDEETVYRLGTILERRGELLETNGAVQLYEKYLARHPESRRVMLNLARVYPEAGRAEEALALYEKLVELDRTNARRYLTELISQYLDLERAGDAIRTAERLVALHPLDPSAHAELARVYERLDRCGDAARALQKALALRPDDVILIESLAGVYETSGEIDKLKELHRRVLRSSANVDACRESARKLMRLTYGTPEFASLERLLEQRRSQNRGEFAYWRALAEFHRAAEHPKEALELLRQAREAVPAASRPDVLAAMSRFCQETGDVASAIRYAEELKDLAGGLPRDVLKRLAGLYLLSGRTAQAHRTFEDWWQTDAENPEVHRMVAEMCLRYGDLPGAIEALSRVLMLPPKQPGAEGEIAHHEVRLQIGGLCERAGRTDDAAKLYFQILDRVPGMRGEPRARDTRRRDAYGMPDGSFLAAQITVGPLTPPPPPRPGVSPTYGEVRAKALEALVRLHVEENRIEELVKVFEDRLTLRGDRRQHYDDLAQVLLQAGETARRVRALERARDAFPEALEYRRSLAGAYRQAGRFEEALRELDAGGRMAPELEQQLVPERIDLCLQLKKTDEVKKAVERLVARRDDMLRVKEVTDKCAEAGEYVLAAELLDGALKTAPQLEENFRLEVAKYLRQAGKPDEVYAHLKKWLDSPWPVPPPVRSPSATLTARRSVLKRLWNYARPADLERLLADREKESDGKPQDLSLLCDVAVLQGRMGRLDAETRTLERILEEEPDAELAAALLRTYRDRGQAAEARDFTWQVLAVPPFGRIRVRTAAVALEAIPGLTPDEPLAGQLVALIAGQKPEAAAEFYWLHGDARRAVEQLRSVADQRPSRMALALRLARYLEFMGHAREADAYARQAAAAVIPPPHPVVLEGKRTLYRERAVQLASVIAEFQSAGFIDALRRRLGQLQSDEPDEPLPAYDLAIVLEKSGSRERAIDVLRKLARRRPEDLACRLALAEVLQGAGRHAEAIRELEQAAAVKPAKREIHETLADAYVRSGARLAEFRLREQMAVLFREPHLLADVAGRYRDLNMNDEAVRVFKRYVYLRHGFGVFYGSPAPAVQEYAQFLRQCGRAEEAIPLLERALAGVSRQVALEDEGAGLRYELASCHEVLGRSRELIRRRQARLDAAPGDVAELDFLASLWAAQGRDDRAVELRQRLATLRPRGVNNLNRLAQTLRHQRRIDEAIEVYNRLLALDPQGASAYLTPIAEMHYERGDLVKAVETVEMHLLERFASTRSVSDRLESVVYLYGRMGLYDREEETCRRIIAETGGESPHAYVLLIRRYLERGRVDAACETAERALEEVRSDWRRSQILDALLTTHTPGVETLVQAAERLTGAPVVLGDVDLAGRIDMKLHERFLEMKRPELAVRYLLRAWQRRRTDRALAIKAAGLLADLGRTGEAEGVLREALVYCPSDVELTLELARTHLTAGHAEEAERVLSDLIRRNPTVEVHSRAGWALAAAGRWRAALPYLQAARRLAGDELNLVVLEADVLVHLGETGRATTLWERMLERSPTEETCLAAGDFFVSLADATRAERAFAAALKLNPNHLEAYRRLGDVLLEAGKHRACIDLYQKALNLFEEKWTRADFARRLQRVYRETGRVDSVVAHAERTLMEADAEWSRLSLTLARRLEADGRRAEAEELYRKLATLSHDDKIRREAHERLQALEDANDRKPPVRGGGD